MGNTNKNRQFFSSRYFILRTNSSFTCRGNIYTVSRNTEKSFDFLSWFCGFYVEKAFGELSCKENLRPLLQTQTHLLDKSLINVSITMEYHKPSFFPDTFQLTPEAGIITTILCVDTLYNWICFSDFQRKMYCET